MFDCGEVGYAGASPMHCRSCSSGFLTGSLHNGFRRRADSTSGSSSSMAMASRVRSVVLCQDDGGRRISYKRRQQLPPRKGLSPIDSTDVFEAHKSLHPHKTRALEFLCDNEETTSITEEDFHVVSDGSWSSRMLMQVATSLSLPLFEAGWLWL